jgi:hypothetical protein
MTDMAEDSADLTPEEIENAKKIFEGKAEGKSGCVHCAGIHDTVLGLPRDRQYCPRVKRAVWHLDGTLVEVEYWPRGQWEPPADQVIYPHEVYAVEYEDDEID